VRVMAERHDALRRGADFTDRLQHAVFLRETEDATRFVVAANIDAVERGARIRAIDVAAGNRRPELPRIGKHRRHVVLTVATVTIRETLEAFIDVPSVILPA